MPVEEDKKGEWRVPDKHLVKGKNNKEEIVLNGSLFGVELADLKDPSAPVMNPLADLYIDEFKRCYPDSKS